MIVADGLSTDDISVILIHVGGICKVDELKLLWWGWRVGDLLLLLLAWSTGWCHDSWIHLKMEIGVKRGWKCKCWQSAWQEGETSPKKERWYCHNPLRTRSLKSSNFAKLKVNVEVKIGGQRDVLLFFSFSKLHIRCRSNFCILNKFVTIVKHQISYQGYFSPS